MLIIIIYIILYLKQIAAYYNRNLMLRSFLSVLKFSLPKCDDILPPNITLVPRGLKADLDKTLLCVPRPAIDVLGLFTCDAIRLIVLFVGVNDPPTLLFL